MTETNVLYMYILIIGYSRHALLYDYNKTSRSLLYCIGYSYMTIKYFCEYVSAHHLASHFMATLLFYPRLYCLCANVKLSYSLIPSLPPSLLPTSPSSLSLSHPGILLIQEELIISSPRDCVISTCAVC